MTDLSSLLKRHRSIRKYKPDPIDSALVEAVCGDATAGGSSSGNLNSVSIVLTRDAERKKWLYEMHFEQSMILEAPLVMTFCADWHRTRRWLRLRGGRDTCVPVTTIVVGYPAEDPPKRDRLPLDAFLHVESYHDPTDAEILETYREREVRGWERYMSYPDTRAEIEARGITSQGDVRTEDSFRTEPRRSSRSLLRRFRVRRGERGARAAVGQRR